MEIRHWPLFVVLGSVVRTHEPACTPPGIHVSQWQAYPFPDLRSIVMA